MNSLMAVSAPTLPPNPKISLISTSLSIYSSISAVFSS